MRYTTRINNVRALEWGINMTQAALFDLINECASWASTATINGVTFYWVSRQLVIEELPLVFRKEDAVYRTLKVLEEKGLVETAKMDGRDYVRITPEGAKWNSHDVPETEPRENSRDIREKNRNLRENSRNSSGKNPTDKDINNQPANQGTNQFGAPAHAPDPPSREPSPPPHAKPKRQSREEVFVAFVVGQGVDEETARCWWQYRDGKPMTSKAWERHCAQAEAAGITPQAAADYTAGRGWAGFYANSYLREMEELAQIRQRRSASQGHVFDQAGNPQGGIVQAGMPQGRTSQMSKGLAIIEQFKKGGRS